MNRTRPRFLGATCGVLALCASVARAGHYTWTTSGPEPGAIFQIVVNPLDSNRIYVLDSYYGYYLFRTIDRGQNWSFVETPSGVATQLVMDPSSPDTLYVPSYPGVAKSLDGGATWFASSSGLPDGAAAYPLALSASAPSTLYAVAMGGFFRSDDAGGHWSPVEGTFPSGYYYRLAADPFDLATLYLLSDLLPLMKTVDGGVT